MSDFENNEQVQDIINAIQSDDGDQLVDQALAAAAELEPEARAYIATTLDKSLIENTMLGLSESEAKAYAHMFKMAAATIKQARAEDPDMVPLVLAKLAESDIDVANFEKLTQLMGFIVENAGDAASAAAKSYAEQAAKVSDTEYNLPETHLKFYAAAIEKTHNITPDAPKKNPFRKDGPGV